MANGISMNVRKKMPPTTSKNTPTSNRPKPKIHILKLTTELKQIFLFRFIGEPQPPNRRKALEESPQPASNAFKTQNPKQLFLQKVMEDDAAALSSSNLVNKNCYTPAIWLLLLLASSCDHIGF
jgi:hypothetical protein